MVYRSVCRVYHWHRGSILYNIWIQTRRFLARLFVRRTLLFWNGIFKRIVTSSIFNNKKIRRSSMAAGQFGVSISSSHYHNPVNANKRAGQTPWLPYQLNHLNRFQFLLAIFICFLNYVTYEHLKKKRKISHFIQLYSKRLMFKKVTQNHVCGVLKFG